MTERPHQKLATDVWRLICVVVLPELSTSPAAAVTSNGEADAAALKLIEMACDAAAESATAKYRLPHITCPTCGKTSYNLNDIRERYCGHCHTFQKDRP